MQKTQRPQLTLKILFYVIFDVGGMLVFATGAMWLAQGLFTPNFPTSKAEAVCAAAVGLVFMFWAATKILRELLNQSANNAQKGA